MTLKQWNRYTDIPLMVLSGIFLFAYSWTILARTHMWLCDCVIDVIWIAYAIDYVVSLILAPNRKVWFKKNLLLLATIALPMFRPLRLLQLLAMLHMFNHGAGMALRGRLAVYAIGMFVMTIYVGALAEYAAEFGAPDARLTSFGVTVWWAFVTVTTVGYGDLYPVTVSGRIVAVFLMLAGIALIGIVTAIIASWIIDQINNETAEQAHEENALVDVESQVLQAQMRELTHSVNELNNEIAMMKRKRRKHKRNGAAADNYHNEGVRNESDHNAAVHGGTVHYGSAIRDDEVRNESAHNRGAVQGNASARSGAVQGSPSARSGAARSTTAAQNVASYMAPGVPVIPVNRSMIIYPDGKNNKEHVGGTVRNAHHHAHKSVRQHYTSPRKHK
ncbi:potassium channel family protein [Bifidobacterium magnum]|uniref:potassium channel family protein n=1 Tax=Bifidobacterium magnum TaxID=1692 RepID=UPI0003B4FBE6|nr:potassium channel family protein [Bifidobacterium magnum]